jgi:hypothetical protein
MEEPQKLFVVRLTQLSAVSVQWKPTSAQLEIAIAA